MPKKTNPSFDETVKGLAPEVLAAFVQYLRSRNFGEDSILFLLGYSSDAAKMIQPRKAKMGGAKAAKLKFSLTQALADFLALSQKVIDPSVAEHLRKAHAWIALRRWDDAAGQLLAAWQVAVASELFPEMDLVAAQVWKVTARLEADSVLKVELGKWEKEFALWVDERYAYDRLLMVLQSFRQVIGGTRTNGGRFEGEGIQKAIHAYQAIPMPTLSSKAQLIYFYLGVYCHEWQGKKAAVMQMALQLTGHIQTRPHLVHFHPEIVFQSYFLCLTLFLDLGKTDLAVSIYKCLKPVVENAGNPPFAVGRLVLACFSLAEALGNQHWALEAERIIEEHFENETDYLKDWEIIRMHFFRLKIAVEQGRLEAVRDPLTKLQAYSRTAVKWEYQLYARIYEIAIAWLRDDWPEMARLTKYAHAFLLRNPEHAQYPFAHFLIGWFGKLAKGKAKTPLPLQLQQFEMDFQAKCGEFVPEGNYLNFNRLIEAKCRVSKIIPNYHRA